MEEMKRKEERLEKDMAEVLLQNKRLTEPLQRAKEEVAELQKQLANYEKDKTSLAVGYTHKHRIHDIWLYGNYREDLWQKATM